MHWYVDKWTTAVVLVKFRYSNKGVCNSLKTGQIFAAESTKYEPASKDQPEKLSYYIYSFIFFNSSKTVAPLFKST